MLPYVATRSKRENRGGSACKMMTHPQALCRRMLEFIAYTDANCDFLDLASTLAEARGDRRCA